MKRTQSMLLGALVALSLAARAQAAGERPVVTLPTLEQGSEVRGAVPIDVVWKPADDGAAVVKLDVTIDDQPIITFDLQPLTRHAQFNWDTTVWPDGQHNIVARVVDSKGRERTYRTHVFVRNRGPVPSRGPDGQTRIEVDDLDGVPDNVITQRALIRVRVNPEVGAKWVVLFLNGQFLAMINYPPYQLTLDPARRNLQDGPYVIQARVIQPDNSEVFPEPVNLVLNPNGTYTQRRPNINLEPPAGARPEVTPDTGARPPVSETPPVATVFEVTPPGGAAPAPAPARAEPAVGERPAAVPGGSIEMPGAGVALPGPVTATRPDLGPTPTATTPPKTTAAARTAPVYGPLRPARSSVGSTAEPAARESITVGGGGAPAGAQTHVPAPAAVARLAAPRTTDVELRVRDGWLGGVEGEAPPARVTSVHPAVPGEAPRRFEPRTSAAGPRTSEAVVVEMAAPAGPAGVTSPRVSLPGERQRGQLDAEPAAAAEPLVAETAGPTTAGGEAVARVIEPGRGRLPAPGAASLAAAQLTATRSRMRVTTRLATIDSSAAALERAPRLGVPGRPTAPQAAPKPATQPPAARRNIGRVHVVQPSDTLTRIARRYGVSVEAIARVNGIHNVHLIRNGQRLVIPVPGAMTVNGRTVATDVAPLQSRQGMATTPFRHVVEALGGSVTWIGAAKRVEANAGARGEIVITIGSRTAQVNDERVLMDLAAYLEQGRTMVDVQFVSNALDVKIEMDEESGNIFVTSNH